MTNVGNVFAPRNPYGPRALIAPGEGWLAWSDGVRPCVHVERIGTDGVDRLCVRRAALPLGPGVRSPDLSDRSEEGQEMLRNVIEAQVIPDSLHHYDRLAYVGGGELWLRRMDERHQDTHLWEGA